MNITHCHVFISKHSVSETGFSLRLQVKLTQLGPIERASLYLRTPALSAAQIVSKHHTKESAHMSLMDHLITKPSLNISPI
jgi:hypothetical protein